MRIVEIQDKNIWESFIKSCAEYTFFHSWSWGEFNRLEGHRIWRLGIYDDDDLVGAVLVLGIKAKRGNFLFVPHGPIIEIKNEKLKSKNDNAKLKTLIDHLKILTRKENYSFIRISPLQAKNAEKEKLFRDMGFRRAPIHMHAESTLLLDIARPEDELLANMRKTTRYLIRKTEKSGVKIKTETLPTGKDFLRLQKAVAGSKHFVAFSEKQIKNEIKALGTGGELEIFNAEYDGEIIASALIIFYGYRTFYYQAASLGKKDIAAPYLLVWQAILEAKKRGCQIFDFYGASPDDQPNHPWAGPTLFKKGFGGYRVDYLPAQDFILSWKYWFTWTVETARRIKRGF